MAKIGPLWIENIYFCHFLAKNPKIALSEENRPGIRFNFALYNYSLFLLQNAQTWVKLTNFCKYFG